MFRYNEDTRKRKMSLCLCLTCIWSKTQAVAPLPDDASLAEKGNREKTHKLKCKRIQ